MSDEPIMTEEKVQELMDFLTGDSIPDKIVLSDSDRLKLSEKEAFRVIWLLQEHYGIIPDNFEKCDGCDIIFDTHNSGFYLDDDYELDGETLPKEYHGHWCDSCVPDVDFKMK